MSPPSTSRRGSGPTRPKLSFAYGPDRLRVYQRRRAGGRVERQWYVGLGGTGQPLYERVEGETAEGGRWREHRQFLYAGDVHGGQPIGVRLVRQVWRDGAWVEDGGAEHRYYHRDHLGSVVAVSDDVGLLGGDGRHVELYSFDPFGAARDPADWSTPTEPVRPSPGNLDYTGQEALPEVGLIHMNGRLYDPELGVFLGPDPYIQAPDLAQNHQRYGYAFNNPLKYTDPSGYFIQIVIAVMLAAAEVYWWQAAIVMFLAAYVQTGDLRTALITAVVTAITYGVGSYFQSVAAAQGGALTASQVLGKALIHGIVQGAASVALGGDFRSGFIGGFLGSATGPLVPQNVVAGTVVSAMIGGTISELTGGKFRNGARSAAMVHLFNEAMHRGSAASASTERSVKPGRGGESG
ncbi:MAG: hypothetical protein KatS3mg121_0795 [Gammaproteobacteria bacterium]|nr:MAG: hypothetical protein KatS3mg121_0795 [Gammaproteobacteria bacterium]